MKALAAAVLLAAIGSSACTRSPSAPAPRPTVRSSVSTTPAELATTGSANVIRTWSWLDRPVEVNSRAITAHTVLTKIRTAHNCDLDQLRIVPQGGGAAGTFYVTLYVRNISAKICSLRGAMRVAFVRADGVVQQSTGPDREHRPARTIVLVPGSWALDPLGGVASDTCGGDESAALRVSTPAGSAVRTLRFPIGAPPRPADCGGRVEGAQPHPGELGESPVVGIPQTNSAFLPFASLVPTLAVPPTVRAGAVLSFTVTMTAPNGKGDVVSPCPIYSMAIGGVTSLQSYLLRCVPATFMHSPGDAVVFDMQIRVPVTARPGPAAVVWRLREPDEPALIAHTTITAP